MKTDQQLIEQYLKSNKVTIIPHIHKQPKQYNKQDMANYTDKVKFDIDQYAQKRHAINAINNQPYVNPFAKISTISLDETRLEY